MKNSEIWRDVFRAVPGVEALRPIPSIVIDDQYCLDNDIRARYENGRIVILKDTSALTIAHEIGHWVYESIFSLLPVNMRSEICFYGATIHEFHWKKLSHLSYAPAIAMVKFLEKIKSTDDYKNLEAWKPDDWESQFLQGKFLTLSETWANAFAQTIAKSHPNSEMAENLKSSVVNDQLKASLWENDGYWRPSIFDQFELDKRVRACLLHFVTAA